MRLKLLVALVNDAPNLGKVQAVIIDQGSLRLDERPDLVPDPGDVVVATHFAGINAADLLQRSGVYPPPPGWPKDVPGMEMCGRVVALGEGVDESLLGRRVCAIVGGGAQATRCRVPARHLIEVPETASSQEAGGFPEAFITAYDALVLQADLRPGERVLISGASGGVGSAAVQIGHLLGAHVIAVTRSASHATALANLGADEVISLEGVAGITPVNVVLELVGAAHLTLAQTRLAPFARIVVIGVSGGGAKTEINLLNIMGTRSTLTGSTLRSRDDTEKAEVIARVRSALIEPWTQGRLSVPLAKTFALDDAAAAYEFFARPGKFGKVLLAMPGAS